MLKKIKEQIEQINKSGLSLYRDMLRYLKDGGKKMGNIGSAMKKLPTSKKLMLIAIIAAAICVIQLIFKSDENKKETTK